jgi:hypothetical protein
LSARSLILNALGASDSLSPFNSFGRLLRLPAVGDNAAMQTEPPKRKRRWFQFSLRTLMIGVTLLAAVCWVDIDRSRLIRERDEAIQKQANAEHGETLLERTLKEMNPLLRAKDQRANDLVRQLRELRESSLPAKP